MYDFKKKVCTNHETPKPLHAYVSPMGTNTLHCPECVNIIELGFVEAKEKNTPSDTK